MCRRRPCLVRAQPDGLPVEPDERRVRRGVRRDGLPGDLDPARREFHYSNAGHCPPLLIHADGRTEELNHSCPVLGEFPECAYNDCVVGLQPGDRLVLFTDGLSEARDPQGREFGIGRLARVAADQRRLRAKGLQAALMQAVFSHSNGRLEDDATLLVVAT